MTPALGRHDTRHTGSLRRSSVTFTRTSHLRLVSAPEDVGERMPAYSIVADTLRRAASQRAHSNNQEMAARTWFRLSCGPSRRSSPHSKGRQASRRTPRRWP